ncbi:MAG: cupredoxin domain-containing protein, partial [Ignavibacteriales bacterium]|nr:cupredoxin domain-containing protein [Ignavibacteriales bacterium]
MKPQFGVLICSLALLWYSGCGSTKEFPAIPKGLDRANVKTLSVKMTAVRYRFTPEEVHVKAGTLVHLEVKSTEGTHGFALDAFGIDETLEEGKTNVIEF